MFPITISWDSKYGDIDTICSKNKWQKVELVSILPLILKKNGKGYVQDMIQAPDQRYWLPVFLKTNRKQAFNSSRSKMESCSQLESSTLSLQIINKK